MMKNIYFNLTTKGIAPTGLGFFHNANLLLVNLRDILLPKLMSGEIRVESHRDETSVETNNDTATLSPIGAAYKTNQHG